MQFFVVVEDHLLLSDYITHLLTMLLLKQLCYTPGYTGPVNNVIFRFTCSECVREMRGLGGLIKKGGPTISVF